MFSSTFVLAFLSAESFAKLRQVFYSCKLFNNFFRFSLHNRCRVRHFSKASAKVGTFTLTTKYFYNYFQSFFTFFYFLVIFSELTKRKSNIFFAPPTNTSEKDQFCNNQTRTKNWNIKTKSIKKFRTHNIKIKHPEYKVHTKGCDETPIDRVWVLADLCNPPGHDSLLNENGARH